MSNFKLRPAPRRRQINILFDPANYSAFPQMINLGGGELLMSFRQAPRQEIVRHTHMRSLITIVRSYDNGATWDLENATQTAAGGGQELGLICLGNGRVGGALAAHNIAPNNEAERAGCIKSVEWEYPYGSSGSWWVWSDNFGLTWPPGNVRLVGKGTMPCAPPVRLQDGTLLYPTYGNDTSEDPHAVSHAYLHHSTDEGNTWSEPVVMAEGSDTTRVYHEPVVIETRPGRVRALHRIGAVKVGPHGQFWTNESTDGGRTWGELSDTGILSGACPRLLNLRDGRLLLTFGRRAEPYGIRAMLSVDGGASWGDTAWELRPERGGDQGYTSSLEVEPGRILTISYSQNARGITGIVGTFWNLPG